MTGILASCAALFLVVDWLWYEISPSLLYPRDNAMAICTGLTASGALCAVLALGSCATDLLTRRVMTPGGFVIGGVIGIVAAILAGFWADTTKVPSLDLLLRWGSLFAGGFGIVALVIGLAWHGLRLLAGN